jgi:competence protein ComEA
MPKNISPKIFYAIGIAVAAFVCGLFYIGEREKNQDVFLISSNILPSPKIETPDPLPEIIESEAPKKIKVYIAGAVKNSGVYELNDGSRIDDVIKLAGGVEIEADLLRINLAAYVKDGQQIIVPKQGEDVDKILQEIENNIEITEEGIAGEKNALVNINTAGEKELMTLPGVGEVTANNIIQYREAHGAFKTTTDIQNVSRIGKKTFEKLKDLITVY